MIYKFQVVFNSWHLYLFSLRIASDPFSSISANTFFPSQFFHFSFLPSPPAPNIESFSVLFP